jgi:DNA-binding MarR family transcriptional regulator
LYRQIKIYLTFVCTNFVNTNMKIEALIKSTIPLDKAKSAVLNIMFTQNLLSEKFNEVLKPFDLSAEQYNVLRILRGQKGKPSNMCIIQERMVAKTSNTTRLVDKLLLKEFVTREICPDNRRKMEVQITPKGLAILLALDDKVKEYETFFARNLTSHELEQLNLLLEKYRNL